MTMTTADGYASVAARERYLPRGLANTHSIFAARAEGTRLWGVDRKEYLDFTSGIGVLNTGHRHPLACASALAVLDVFETEGLVARAVAIGDQIRAALLRLQARVPWIGDVRGLGAMLAIELVADPATRAPDAELAQRIIDQARERGLLLLKCGPHKNVVRLLPPLTATAEEITSGVAMLEAAVLDG